MRTPLVLLVSAALAASLALAGCAEAPPAEEVEDAPSGSPAGAGEVGPSSAFEDPEVERVWSRMMDTLAVDGGWSETRYVQFDWIVERGEGAELRRSHRWDVWGGRYRLEAPMGEDGTMVALFDVDDPTGNERVFLDGEEVTDGARSDTLASRAHAMFINDSYWLLMPYKWADPGVVDAYVGEVELGGETYEVVELTFEDVGLTPQNKYRAFVRPESGLMEVWQHYRSAEDEEPAFTLAWTDWAPYGPIMLSSRREDPEGNAPIRFENLDASKRLPEGAFEPPVGG